MTEIGEGIALPNPASSGQDSVEPADSSDSPVSLRVTVRRDFPLREGERFGAWTWTDANGRRTGSNHRWVFDGTPFPGEELRPLVDLPIFGWSIGAGSLNGSGRQLTTSRVDPIAAEVKLFLRSSDHLLASARTAGADGIAELDTTGMNVNATIQIHPDDCCEVETGPNMTFPNANPRIAYRLVTVDVCLRDGLLVEVSDPYDPHSGNTSARVGSRAAHLPLTDHLPISLKPVWWRHPNPEVRPPNSTIDMVVIHCTGGARMGGALNEFFGEESSLGAHYMVDIDGHVIKLVNEVDSIHHVARGYDRWERQIPSRNRNNNERSVGIEIINPINYGGYESFMVSDAAQPYNWEQYQSLIALLQRIVRAHPQILHKIIGHSDVACGPTKLDKRTEPESEWTPRDQYGTRRQLDPGERFQWRRLSETGLGMVPDAEFTSPNMYDDVFASFPGIELREGDRDPTARPGIYGNVARPGFVGSPIRMIQQDLREIGYSVRRANGRFDAWTAGAVDRFKRHFEAATGKQINSRTALLIRNVAEQVQLSNLTTGPWL